MRNILVAVSVALLIGAGCKDKEAKTPQKPVKTVVVQKPVEKDTLKEEANPVVKEEPAAAKPADKYFLIAGSFENRENAEIFKAKLMADGYKAQVIERPAGPNGEFYKVSYKSFYDRAEAYAELSTARNVEGRDEVWLLVKK